METGEKTNKKDLLKILMWSGSVMAITSAVVYVAIVYILVKGFEQSLEQNKLLLFVALGSIVGLLITFSLRIQGIELAKNEEVSKIKLAEYNSYRAKDKKVKIRPITFYVFWKTIADFFTRGLTTAFMVYFSITIIIEGIHDERYIGMAVANVIFFLGLGLTQLAAAYQKYMNDHLVYLDLKINRIKEKNKNELFEETLGADETRLRAVEGRGTSQKVANTDDGVRVGAGTSEPINSGEEKLGSGLLKISEKSSCYDR